MQLWFAHSSDVTLREQLVTQVILGILSDDLLPGQRLPSTRELARRFRLHPNTVSAAYRQLERNGWLESRRGSGVYVRAARPETPLSPALALDQLIVGLFRSARKLGAPLPMVRARLRRWLALRSPDHFLFIEPEQELIDIVATEVRQAVSLPVRVCTPQDCRRADVLGGAIPLAMASKAASVRRALPPGADLITLHARSVPASLAEWLPAPSGALVAIASSWPRFLHLARTMLVAAGIDADGLLFRDARKRNWQRGLKEARLVVCDSVTAQRLPKSVRAVPFRLLSDASLAELREYEKFLRKL